MLEADRIQQMKRALDALPCHVVVPETWVDFHHRRGPLKSAGKENRAYVRSHFPARALLELETSLPSVPRDHEKHVVLMKDLSRGGAAFLHSAELFPGEEFKLWLYTGPRMCRVVRTTHHNDACYEMGVEFLASTGLAPPEGSSKSGSN